jgi:hypothetical protein
MDPIPPGSNPFNHDFFNMGTPIGTNVMIMYGATEKEEAKYIIVVNLKTGERLRIVEIVVD